MSADTTDLGVFYASALGDLACRRVGRVVGEMWPGLRGLRLLGIGYAAPYLPALAGACERTLSFTAPGQSFARWPGGDCPASALADPLYLPLPDASIDRILAVHALESVEDPGEFLHEISRVLGADGRAILVCPNRRGLWARMDTTPFGHGQPFSRSQLRRLMRDSLLTPLRWRETLYVPPVENRLVMRCAQAWESFGAALSLPFAGLHVVEAARLEQRLVPVRDRRRARRSRPLLVPVPATGTALGRSETPPGGPACGQLARCLLNPPRDSTIEL